MTNNTNSRSKLIVLHGWGHKSCDEWDEIKSSLPVNVEFLCLEMPGFGSREIMSTTWGVPEYANWVIGQIESKYPHTSIILLGHSFGGRVASWIAVQRPVWLRALILSGAPSLRRPSIKVRLKIFTYKLLKNLFPGVLKSLRKTFSSDDLTKVSYSPKSQILYNVVNFDQTQQLKQINVPSLLIWGKADDQVPVRIAREMRSLILGSKLEVITNAGHQSWQEQPQQFSKIVTNFILST